MFSPIRVDPNRIVEDLVRNTIPGYVVDTVSSTSSSLQIFKYDKEFSNMAGTTLYYHNNKGSRVLSGGQDLAISQASRGFLFEHRILKERATALSVYAAWRRYRYKYLRTLIRLYTKATLSLAALPRFINAVGLFSISTISLCSLHY